MFRPLPVVFLSISEGRSICDGRDMPDPASLTPVFVATVQINLGGGSRHRTDAAQLQRASPRGVEAVVELNAAPPAAIVVPAPLSSFSLSENVDRPDTVNVPVPFSSPPDCVIYFLFSTFVLLFIVILPLIGCRAFTCSLYRHFSPVPTPFPPPPPPPILPFTVVVPPSPEQCILPIMLEAASSVRVPPPNWTVPAPS